MENLDTYLENGTTWLIEFTPKLILAIVILVVGFWVARKSLRLLNVSLERANVSAEIQSFLDSILEIVLKFIVILIAAGTLGFQVSSLLGVLAAAAFAIGLALQGFLGNFAAGITIVFFKPYKVGDWVEVSEKFGRVSSIKIFSTTIITPGQKTHIIPNGQVTDNIITNYSSQGHIRLELSVSMPYSESFPRVREVISNALKASPNILHEPEPEIGIINYDSHYLELAVRPFIHPDNYWESTFDTYQRIKAAFSESEVQMAYSEGVELGKIGN